MENQTENLGLLLSLKERVYESLKSQIIRGRLEPGTRLLEVELSSAMNISRAPIREALNMLHRDGFATITPRRGTIVSLITPEDVDNNWEMRELLEPYGAQVSCKDIPQEEIQALHDRLTQVLDHPDDFEAYMESDLAVHELLSKYVSNRQLREVLTTTKAHSMRMRYFAENNHPTRADLIQAVTRDHLAITQALAGGDPANIHDTVLRHIRSGRNRALVAIQ